jgi:hypothetical protein
MPNCCANRLSSDNLAEAIRPYLTKIKGEHILDFEKIIPMPYGIKELAEMTSLEEIQKKRTPNEEEAWKKLREDMEAINQANYGHRTWYDWSVSAWGTKWNCKSLVGLKNVAFPDNTEEENKGRSEKLEDVDSIEFQTAWAPPLPVIRELYRLTGIPLRMSYYDESWMFGGVFTIDATGESDECYNDPADCPEDLKEELDAQYHIDCRNEEEEDNE